MAQQVSPCFSVKIYFLVQLCSNIDYINKQTSAVGNPENSEKPMVGKY